MMRVTLEDGKYTVLYGAGVCKALRYGEEWRDLTGDKLIGCMVDRILDQEARLAALENAHNNAIDEAIEKVKVLTLGMPMVHTIIMRKALEGLKK